MEAPNLIKYCAYIALFSLLIVKIDTFITLLVICAILHFSRNEH